MRCSGSHMPPGSVTFVKIVSRLKTQFHWRLKRYDKCQRRKKKAKWMSRDQVIPLSRKAEVTRLRKELSRWTRPGFAPVQLKQALCFENASKPVNFCAVISPVSQLSTLGPFSLTLDSIWELANLNVLPRGFKVFVTMSSSSSQADQWFSRRLAVIPRVCLQCGPSLVV